MKYLTKDLITP